MFYFLLVEISFFTSLIFILGIFAAVALFELYALLVVPYLLQQETIDLIIEDLIEQHSDKALDAAIAREEWAQQDTDTFAQGKWRRIRQPSVSNTLNTDNHL